MLAQFLMRFTRSTVPNALRALAAFVRALFQRQHPALADSAVTSARLERCEACCYFDTAHRQCRLCTCFVDVKTLLATESCPGYRWHPQTKFNNGL